MENAVHVHALTRTGKSSRGGRMRAPRPGVLQERLTALCRDRDCLQSAMYEAAQLQRRLGGPHLVQHGPYEIASEIFPVCDVSGDFICVFEHDDDLVFAIGDIAGKGLASGMWYTHVVAMVRLQIETLRDPAAAISAMNRDLLLTRLVIPLITMILGRLNARTGEITYCVAGHPPALVLRRGASIDRLYEGGPVVGALPEARYVDGRTRLYPGDTFLGYSDGIAECRNEDGMEFGTEGITSIARVFHGTSASNILFSILGAAADFGAGQSREDDMSLIVVRRDDE